MNLIVKCYQNIRLVVYTSVSMFGISKILFWMRKDALN